MISAKVICDSVSEQGIRLTTFVVEFPRYILAEYNTHRMFSRNASSTRAIPIMALLEQITDNPAMPIYYGKNQSGMSAKEELPPFEQSGCKRIIKEMRDFCHDKVKELHELGLHKQHAGRYIEAWQTVKGVLTFTEGDNWYWLRDDEAAQPEIAKLAQVMRKAQDESVPDFLRFDELHLPYVTYFQEIVGYTEDDESILGPQIFYMGDLLGTNYEVITREEAIKVSCARCAAVSYRKEDYNLEKCLQMYDRLVGSDKKHSSALEHVASPMKREADISSCDYFSVRFVNQSVNLPGESDTWQDGVSHADRDGQLWSGNLRGWIQHRKTVDGENYIG